MKCEKETFKFEERMVAGSEKKKKTSSVEIAEGQQLSKWLKFR